MDQKSDSRLHDELEKDVGISVDTIRAGEWVNASGHVQELSRNYNLLSAATLGMTVGCVWPAVGSSILTSIFNGGPPGVLYEFIVVSLFYFAVGASIAELASAIPSSGGVYHWATVTAGDYGRIVGFFAGYWNWLSWTLGGASVTFIFSNTVVQMWALEHPDFIIHPWHIFVVYLITTWIICFVVCFFNKLLPYLIRLGGFFIVVGFVVTVVVVTVMPGMGGRPGHATSSFVWRDWTADIGYPDGFVFVAGMLNGAFSVGVPDAISHLAEEIPDPQRNIPKAMACQIIIGFVTGFAYLIAILYAINDYDALFDSSYPLAEIYYQATGSSAGAIGLLIFILCVIFLCSTGAAIDAGRTLWALGRDRATPFPQIIGKVNKKLDMPFNATIASTICATILGCIYVGSSTAFNAFVSTYVLLSSSSYIAAILPHLLTGRKNIIYGPFRLGQVWGPTINAIACGYMTVWFVIYCFPYSLPVTAQNMNYSCLIWGGLTVFIAFWWIVGSAQYEGPKARGGVTEVEAVRGNLSKS